MPPSNRPRRSFTCPPLVRRLRTFARSLSITMPTNKPTLPSSQSADAHTPYGSTSSSASSLVEVESNPDSALSPETASIASIPSDTSSSSSAWTTDDGHIDTNPVDDYMTNALTQPTLTSQFQSLSISSSSPSPFQLSSSSPTPFPPPSLSTAYPYDTYTPLTSTSIHNPHPSSSSSSSSATTPPTTHEIAQKRTAFFLHLRAFYQGLLPDPFHEFRALSSGLFGAILPPDFYLASAPFPPRSVRGAVRLRFIRAALSMPPSAPLARVEGFIGRNPSVVSHLCFNIQPYSDLVFEPHHHPDHQIYVAGPAALEWNDRLLRAIKELAWGDERADWVVNLARTEDAGGLGGLCKTKGKRVLPSVRERMLLVEDRGERPVQDEQWHKQAVKQMRRERPISLLRNVVLPHEVVEETEQSCQVRDLDREDGYKGVKSTTHHVRIL
ncbi:hypothetical protein J3F83DRAFT_601199 [Trichoderma novae-zelandiae]